MEYTLEKSCKDDIERLIDYKKKTIYEYAYDLSQKEIQKIDDYVFNEVSKLLSDYCNIVVDGKIVGCLLVTNIDDGKLLDEIYIEENYRGRGIGSDIIRNVLYDNDIVYLWVYKANKRAISLYERLGFSVIRETDSRFYMRCSK